MWPLYSLLDGGGTPQWQEPVAREIGRWRPELAGVRRRTPDRPGAIYFFGTLAYQASGSGSR